MPENQDQLNYDDLMALHQTAEQMATSGDPRAQKVRQYVAMQGRTLIQSGELQQQAQQHQGFWNTLRDAFLNPVNLTPEEKAREQQKIADNIRQSPTANTILNAQSAFASTIPAAVSVTARMAASANNPAAAYDPDNPVNQETRRVVTAVSNARAAAKRGDALDATRHAINAVPVLGGIAQASGDQAMQGDNTGAVGTGIGNVASLYALDKAGEAAPEAISRVKKAVQDVQNARVATKAASGAQIENRAVNLDSLVQMSGQAPKNVNSMETLTTPTVDTLRQSAADLQAKGYKLDPQNMTTRDFQNVTRHAMDTIEDKVAPALDMISSQPLTAAEKAKIQGAVKVPQASDTLEPSVAAEVRNLQERLGNIQTVGDANAVRQMSNRLSNAYQNAHFIGQINAPTMGETFARLGDAARDAIYDGHLESVVPGVRALKQTEGALMRMQQVANALDSTTSGAESLMASKSGVWNKIREGDIPAPNALTDTPASAAAKTAAAAADHLIKRSPAQRVSVRLQQVFRDLPEPSPEVVNPYQQPQLPAVGQSSARVIDGHNDLPEAATYPNGNDSRFAFRSRISDGVPDLRQHDVMPSPDAVANHPAVNANVAEQRRYANAQIEARRATMAQTRETAQAPSAPSSVVMRDPVELWNSVGPSQLKTLPTRTLDAIGISQKGIEFAQKMGKQFDTLPANFQRQILTMK